MDKARLKSTILFTATVIVVVFSHQVQGSITFRDVDVNLEDSVVQVGGFGAGVFWYAAFSFAPLTLDIGDTLDVTVHLDEPVTIFAGQEELESVGSFAFGNESFDTMVTVNMDFLAVDGELFENHFSGSTHAQGGIGYHTGSSADLTDSWFSFQQFHYSITINSGTPYPGIFDNGRIVGTQGSVHLGSIPEPTTFIVWSFLAFCGIALASCRMRRE